MNHITINIENKDYNIADILEKLANKKRWDYHALIIEQTLILGASQKEEDAISLKNLINDMITKQII